MLMRSRGFTLIELLVVVSIISVLAAVILSALYAARDQGRIGADMTFNGTNYHALGVNALAIYHLEDDYDNGPMNNNLTWVGIPRHAQGILNQAALFDGSNYATTPSMTLGSSWTMSTWFKLNTTPPYGFQILLSYNLPYIGLDLGNGVVFGAFWDGNSGHQVYVPSNWWQGPSFSQNKWYLVTMTHDDAKQTTTLYFDGQPVSVVTGETNIQTCQYLFLAAMNSVCGASGYGTYRLTGLLDDVYIYPQALSAGAIEREYAMGAVNHMFAFGGRTYNPRIPVVSFI